ncbi:hypothetical protein Bpfe_018384 [Biomphalaria pfeifferi]|uniref:Uncharacterized protein n=1 Tax=Biomphalaria pfeifferi TaxID=112525 RepID=A0AAD8BD79_BIOPF|nr:hypothetical protein Bpfe_018384 [Biomphalaria pfeifferi]
MPVASPYSEIWKLKLDHPFNTMALAVIFRASGWSLILGCEDGLVRIHDLSAKHLDNKPKTVLETKSGPIQALTVYDVTRFYHNDLIVCDSCGMLTVFCNKQILSRQSLSSDSLICCTVVEENGGSPVIVCSNDSGVITGVQPTEELWRINLNSLSNKNPSTLVRISCMLVVYLTDSTGNRKQYLLAADNAKRIHVISNGTIVNSLVAPVNITAMCQGRFIPSNKLSLASSPTLSTDGEQVALGSSSGSVYILHNFNITLDDYVNTKSPITSLCTLPQSDHSTDLLLCAGHFSSLHLYRDGQLFYEYLTSDWVNNIATADIDDDGVLEVIIGCMDKTVVALKV